jgi:hypothetical protein
MSNLVANADRTVSRSLLLRLAVQVLHKAFCRLLHDAASQAAALCGIAAECHHCFQCKCAVIHMRSVTSLSLAALHSACA